MTQLKIYLPPPASWQDFQLLVKDIAQTRYNPGTVVEYGRQGQRQHGVDVYAEDFFGRRIGIQCKETKDKLTKHIIISEADDAKNFTTQLDLFIIATTARTDAPIQDDVIAINASNAYPFKVKVEFWDELVNDINRYAMVLNSCYSSYGQALKGDDEINHLSCLRIAFDRPAFTDDFLHERNYPDFEEALVATKRLFRTGFTLDRWSKIPVVQTIPVDFLPVGNYRKFVDSIEMQLAKLYKEFLADKTKILADNSYARDRAGHYNILRRELLQKLNVKLEDFQLTPIDYAYA